MRFLYLSCACLLVALTTAAQRNFVPGTLLLRNGDSLRGQVDYRKWDINPLTISFRESETGVGKNYAPEEIKGFRVMENDDVYLSVPAVLDVTNETAGALAASPLRDTVRGEHFYRVLVAGPVKLLLYTDGFRRNHFALVENDRFTQLIKKEEYIHDMDSPAYRQIKTHSLYRQQLAVAFGNCVPPQRLDALAYTETSLRKIVQQYAGCRYPGEQVVSRKDNQQMRLTFGVIAGAGLNTYNFTGTHPLTQGRYGSDVSPVIGVFMDIPISRNRQKLSWNNEVIYTTRALSASWKKNSFRYDVDINLQYIQVQSLIKYTLPKGNLRPYVNVGVAGTLCIGGKDEFITTDEGSFNPRPMVEKAIEGRKGFSAPLMAGVGVRYNRLHVEARYIAPHNLSTVFSLSAKMTTVQLLVRYSLF